MVQYFSRLCDGPLSVCVQDGDRPLAGNHPVWLYRLQVYSACWVVLIVANVLFFILAINFYVQPHTLQLFWWLLGQSVVPLQNLVTDESWTSSAVCSRQSVNQLHLCSGATSRHSMTKGWPVCINLKTFVMWLSGDHISHSYYTICFNPLPTPCMQAVWYCAVWTSWLICRLVTNNDIVSLWSLMQGIFFLCSQHFCRFPRTFYKDSTELENCCNLYRTLFWTWKLLLYWCCVIFI